MGVGSHHKSCLGNEANPTRRKPWRDQQVDQVSSPTRAPVATAAQSPLNLIPAPIVTATSDIKVKIQFVKALFRVDIYLMLERSGGKRLLFNFHTIINIWSKVYYSSVHELKGWEWSWTFYYGSMKSHCTLWDIKYVTDCLIESAV